MEQLPTAETHTGSFQLRLDDGTFFSIEKETICGGYEMNPITQQRRQKRELKSINPHLSQRLEIGSILVFGEKIIYQVTTPQKFVEQEHIGRSVFIKKIDSALVNKYQESGKDNMIYSLDKGNIPFDQATATYFAANTP